MILQSTATTNMYNYKTVRIFYVN